ncbi:nucleotidyltransferase [candidate division KSB3 bacterium]|uniref:Nucleotidyltransferase n=1 Tax=candidate division KSB3 bacterium TaxID=2044937 RepID=A0A2G6E711_9BACT|nr:MAG: nucleotidyltransferase [candidate division KSB3 bacterium]PIE30157.1 MAG: nucleotidyltransferase [candidate division KSB3 bacterium]
MKAMIFAAGLGTRLRPLTDTCPKALLTIEGRPLLEIVIHRLKHYGFRELVINVHHLAEQILEFLAARKNFGLDIQISDETALLLDTGGALKAAAALLNDGRPFLVHNVDILSEIDVKDFYEWHCRRPYVLASLAVSRRPSTRCLLFDREQRLCGWRHRKSKETIWAKTCPEDVQELAFSGVHVIDPKIFSYLPEKKVFSIIDVYLQAAGSEAIVAYPHEHRLWLDVGKTTQLKRAREILMEIEARQGKCTPGERRRL